MLQRAKVLHAPIKTKPDFGTPLEVSKGIFLLKMPIPFALDHINLWLLRDLDGWTIVDTGFYCEESIQIWEDVLSNFCQQETIHKIIVTHFHPDHLGMAHWLTKKTQAPLYMSRAEFLTAQQAYQEPTPAQTLARVEFYQHFGLSEEDISSLIKRRPSSEDAQLPATYRRLEAEQHLDINHEKWRVLSFAGHSPEHLCLHLVSRDILIAGDQVLPTISPNISVAYSEPDANVLAAYLDSLLSLARLDVSTRVLPSHGVIFDGLQERANNLRLGHEKALEQIRKFCKQPRTGRAVMEEMFGTRLSVLNKFLAVGEAKAHLNFLMAKQELSLKVATVDQYQII